MYEIMREEIKTLYFYDSSGEEISVISTTLNNTTDQLFTQTFFFCIPLTVSPSNVSPANQKKTKRKNGSSERGAPSPRFFDWVLGPRDSRKAIDGQFTVGDVFYEECDEGKEERGMYICVKMCNKRNEKICDFVGKEEEEEMELIDIIVGEIVRISSVLCNILNPRLSSQHCTISLNTQRLNDFSTNHSLYMLYRNILLAGRSGCCFANLFSFSMLCDMSNSSVVRGMFKAFVDKTAEQASSMKKKKKKKNSFNDDVVVVIRGKEYDAENTDDFNSERNANDECLDFDIRIENVLTGKRIVVSRCEIEDECHIPIIKGYIYIDFGIMKNSFCIETYELQIEDRISKFIPMDKEIHGLGELINFLNLCFNEFILSF